MTEELQRILVEKALDARNNSYCPYSGFAVGAALLCKTNGDEPDKIYLGCNIENSSYGATNCAERTAIFKAVSEGYREFKAIAIVGAPKGELPRDYAYPCGICRQVMSEFCSMDFEVIVAISTEKYKVYQLKDLLPEAFSAASME